MVCRRTLKPKRGARHRFMDGGATAAGVLSAGAAVLGYQQQKKDTFQCYYPYSFYYPYPYWHCYKDPNTDEYLHDSVLLLLPFTIACTFTVIIATDRAC